MKLLNFINNLFSKPNEEWMVRYMMIEYQKDYINLQKNGVIITPDVAKCYLENVGKLL